MIKKTINILFLIMILLCLNSCGEPGPSILYGNFYFVLPNTFTEDDVTVTVEYINESRKSDDEIFVNFFGIITDGTTFYWINPQIVREQAEFEYLDEKSNKTRWYSYFPSDVDCAKSALMRSENKSLAFTPRNNETERVVVIIIIATVIPA